MSVHEQPGPSSVRAVCADDELSEYERMRLKNIKDIYEQFGELFVNVHKSAEVLQTATKSSLSPIKSGVRTNGRKHTQNSRRFKLGSRPKLLSSDNVRQSARLSGKRKETKYNELSDSDDEPKKKKIKIKFPFVKTSEKHTKIKRRTVSRTSKGRKMLLVSDVTQEMLSNIAYSSSGKVISDNGTTCHQCRQKTLDQKSCCRYELCKGIRGMFCGFCLQNRYGEDVANVLQNPNWICPVCRNECNCSICRRKQGLDPTGQMSQQATAHGYKSVRHYLCKNEDKLLNCNANHETENVKPDNNIDSEESGELTNLDFVEIKTQKDSPEMILNKLYKELFSTIEEEEEDDDEFDLQ